MGNGTSETMVSVAIGSRDEVTTEKSSNTNFFFCLDTIQPGEMFVQTFEYCGTMYRFSMENCTYSDKGGGTMYDLSQPFQETKNSSLGTYPLTPSKKIIRLYN